MDLKLGDKAPAFKLGTDGGGEIASAALKGMPFVVYFYPKDNTAGCTREATGFTQLARQFKELGVTVIGISKDSVASHETFREKHNLKMILASDPETKTAQSYGVWVKKTLYGRTSMGVERSTFLIGGSGKIQAIWRKVKVDGHAEAVLAAAKAL
jgi:thioredoxin-dependent peroxiredoxin